MYDRSRGGYQRPVFDAVDDGNGNIELSYAIADRFERVSNNRSVATFQVSMAYTRQMGGPLTSTA